MPSTDFATSFQVTQGPAEVYEAINDVRRWWTGDVEGDADQVGDEFSYRYPGAHYSKQRVTELVPAHKVVWQVIDSRLEGPDDPSEWTGTDIIFEISAVEDGTEVRFAHVGLVPEFECFDSCSSAWGFYVHGSLKHLITTGEGPVTPPWA